MKQKIKEIIQNNFNRLGYRITRSPDSVSNTQVMGNITDGNLLLCNFCGTIFRRITGFHSEFLECPHCGAIARERVVYQCILADISKRRWFPTFMIDQTLEFHDLRVLECSPRQNEHRKSIYQKTFGQYITSDFDLSAHTADIHLDLTNDREIQQYDGHFDIIICAHVLEHIPDFRKALQNLQMMLAPGGKLALQVPILEKEYSPASVDEFHMDHTRVYHRFGFDLMLDLENIFREVVVVVGLLDFPITSPEINPEKYDFLKSHLGKCHVIGNHLLMMYGLGIPDLCEAFIVYK